MPPFHCRPSNVIYHSWSAGIVIVITVHESGSMLLDHLNAVDVAGTDDKVTKQYMHIYSTIGRTKLL